MDWSNWMHMTEAQQEELRARYRRHIAEERDKNRARWDRMTREQKARYPEIKPRG